MSLLQAARSEASSRKSAERSAMLASRVSRHPGEKSDSYRFISRQSIARMCPGGTSAQNCTVQARVQQLAPFVTYVVNQRQSELST